MKFEGKGRREKKTIVQIQKMNSECKYVGVYHVKTSCDAMLIIFSI